MKKKKKKEKKDDWNEFVGGKKTIDGRLTRQCVGARRRIWDKESNNTLRTPGSKAAELSSFLHCFCFVTCSSSGTSTITIDHGSIVHLLPRIWGFGSIYYGKTNSEIRVKVMISYRFLILQSNLDFPYLGLDFFFQLCLTLTGLEKFLW